MKTAITMLLFLGCCLLCTTGCTYDIETELNPICDTASMDYQKITAVLQEGTCLTCHSGANAEADLDFSTYTGISAYLDNPSNQLLDRITIGSTGDLMPPNGNRLSNCNVSKIRAWLNKNYPQ